MSSDHSYIYGDFAICPLEVDKPGHMRRVSVAGAEKVVVQTSSAYVRRLGSWSSGRRMRLFNVNTISQVHIPFGTDGQLTRRI
jgi:hypothetical protein